MRITYLVPSLSDAAAAQRVRMLRAGGAEVKLIGFRRSAAPVSEVEGVPAVDLGQTFEQRFFDRTIKVLDRSFKAWRLAALMRDADVVMARNLEMWTIAAAGRRWANSRVPIIYECLDVHGLMSRGGLPSKLLREWERRALRKSAALVVSSPGFMTNHFDRLGVTLPPTILAENKRVLSEIDDRAGFTGVEAVPPWRIGWFGMIRCVESFQILFAAAQRYPELVDIVLRGRPTGKLQQLIDDHLPLPNMRFGGSYHLSELAAMYGDCHLTWAIDYSERGFNSDWLLPNRIYEGGYFNNPAIALAGTETANWLRSRGAGVLLESPQVDLEQLVANLTPARYCALQAASAAVPTADLVYTLDESRRLTTRIFEAASRGGTG